MKRDNKQSKVGWCGESSCGDQYYDGYHPFGGFCVILQVVKIERSQSRLPEFKPTSFTQNCVGTFYLWWERKREKELQKELDRERTSESMWINLKLSILFLAQTGRIFRGIGFSNKKKQNEKKNKNNKQKKGECSKARYGIKPTAPI